MHMHMFLASLYPPLKRKTGQSLEREREKNELIEITLEAELVIYTL